MFAQRDKPDAEKMYSDIEGGLGWWRDTRFATETPKFIMGGVALNFSEWRMAQEQGKAETGISQRESMEWLNLVPGFFGHQMA